MPGPRLLAAQQLVTDLAAAGIPATCDPTAVAGLWPATGGCVVLLTPPRVGPGTYTEPAITWRLVLLASSPDPLEAWRQLDEALEAVWDVLPLELAEPGAYTLTHLSPDPRPAYVLTLTD